MPGGALRADNVPLAVAVILGTVLALSLGDALVKLTSDDFVLWQIFVVRSLIALPILAALTAARSPEALRHLPLAPGWTTLRSLLLVAMWVFYYLSLPWLALSIAAATYYTLPIFITLFSAALTRERIGRAGWIAVLSGFLGVLLILRPRAGDFNAYALLPLLSAMLYALAMILTRTRCRGEHPLVLALALNIAFVVVGGAATLLVATLPDELRRGFLLASWTPMNPSAWATMALLAAAILVGSLGAAVAYQNGPPAVIGTFDFAYVGFAVIWGILLLGEVPDTLSLAGMALIVTAGTLALRR